MKKIFYLLILSPLFLQAQIGRLGYQTLQQSWNSDYTKTILSTSTVNFETNKSAFNFNKPIWINGEPITGGASSFPYTKTFAIDSSLRWKLSPGNGLYIENSSGNQLLTLDSYQGVTINSADGNTSLSCDNIDGLSFSGDTSNFTDNSLVTYRWTNDRIAGFQNRTWGADVAAAATITPTGPMFRITGSGTISTINIPYTGFSGVIKIVAMTGAIEITDSGNIYLNAITGQSKTFVHSRMYELAYDPATSKWYVTD